MGVSAPDPNAAEMDSSTGVFRVTLSEPAGAAEKVYFTLGGEATYSESSSDLSGDYTLAASGELGIDASTGRRYVEVGEGQDSAWVRVVPTGDGAAESTETVAFTLVSMAGFALAATTAAVAIVDANTEIRISLTAYRSPGAGLDSTYVPKTEVKEEEEEKPGVGIRVNQDSDNDTGRKENDLAPLTVTITELPGARAQWDIEYKFVRQLNRLASPGTGTVPLVRVWLDDHKGTGVLVDDPGAESNPLEPLPLVHPKGLKRSQTYWVEYLYFARFSEVEWLIGG